MNNHNIKQACLTTTNHSKFDHVMSAVSVWANHVGSHRPPPIDYQGQPLTFHSPGYYTGLEGQRPEMVIPPDYAVVTPIGYCGIDNGALRFTRVGLNFLLVLLFFTKITMQLLFMLNIKHRLVLSRRPGIISAFIEGDNVLLYNHSLARWNVDYCPLHAVIRNNKRAGSYYFGYYSLVTLLSQLHAPHAPRWNETNWGYEISFRAMKTTGGMLFVNDAADICVPHLFSEININVRN